MNLEREQAKKIYRTGDWANWIGGFSSAALLVFFNRPIPLELKSAFLAHFLASLGNGLYKGRQERKIMEKFPGIEFE